MVWCGVCVCVLKLDSLVPTARPRSSAFIPLRSARFIPSKISPYSNSWPLRSSRGEGAGVAVVTCCVERDWRQVQRLICIRYFV